MKFCLKCVCCCKNIVVVINNSCLLLCCTCTLRIVVLVYFDNMAEASGVSVDDALQGLPEDVKAAVKAMGALLLSTLQGTKEGSMRMRANVLKPFDGSRPYDLYGWLDEAKLIMLANGEHLDSPRSLAKLATYMEGAALRAYHTRKHEMLDSFEDFKTGLIESFGLFTNKEAAVHALINLCNTKASNYAEFEYTFNGIYNIILDGKSPDLLTIDEDLMHYTLFTRALPSVLDALVAEFADKYSIRVAVFPLQKFLTKRIKGNQQLTQQVLGVNSQGLSGPTPMELGFSRVIPKGNNINVEEAEVGYVGRGGRSRGRGRGFSHFSGARGRGRGRSFSQGRYNSSYHSNQFHRGGYQGGYQGRSRGGSRFGASRGRSNPGRGNSRGASRGRGRQPMDWQWTNQGQPICNNCGQAGHVWRNCPSRQVHNVEVEDHPSANVASVNTASVQGASTSTSTGTSTVPFLGQ